MRKFCVAVFGLLSCILVCAVESADVLGRFSGEEKIWITNGLTAKDVTGMFARACQNIENVNDGKPILFNTYSGRVGRFKKYEFFESDTGISKKWLDSCDAFLKALKNARSKMSAMEAKKQTKTKEYKRWEKYYKDTAKQFSALVKKPIPANKVTVNTLAQKKKALLAAYEKEQKAKAEKNKVPLKK